MVGTTISHYKVLEKIGQGGTGDVDDMIWRQDRFNEGFIATGCLCDTLAIGVVPTSAGA